MGDTFISAPIYIIEKALTSYLQERNYPRIRECFDLGADPNGLIKRHGYDEPQMVSYLFYAYDCEYQKHRTLAHHVYDFSLARLILEYHPLIEDDVIWIFYRFRGYQKNPRLQEHFLRLIELTKEPIDFNQVDERGFPPLSRTRDPFIFQYLIDHGADINYLKDNQDKWGIWSILMIEIFNVNLESIELLIKHGVDLDVTGIDDDDGTISGTPNQVVTTFDFVRDINQRNNHDDLQKMIYDYLYQQEIEYYQEIRKTLSPVFPKIIIQQIHRYLLHPEVKDLSDLQLESGKI